METLEVILFAVILIPIFLLIIYSSKEYKVLFFLVFLTQFIRSLFNTNEPVWVNEEIETGIGGYTRAAIIVLAGFGGLVVLIQNLLAKKLYFEKNIFLLLLFILTSLFSTFYSVEPSVTLNRSLIFLMLFFFLWGASYRINCYDDLDNIINILFLATVIVTISCLISLAVPSRSWYWKANTRFIGLFSNPNEAGAFFMLSYPIIYWKYYEAQEGKNIKLFLMLFFILTIFLHLLTGSRTSIITSIIGSAIWFFIQGKKTKILLSLLSIITLTSILFLFYTPENMTRGEEEKTMATTTGRDFILKSALFMLVQKPLTGYGYLVESKIFADKSLITLEQDWITPTAQMPLHNGYISIAVGNGLIVFVIWLIIIFTPIMYAHKIKNINLIKYKSLILSTVSMILIANLFESLLTGYLGSGNVPFWISWLFAVRLKYLK